MQENEEWNIMEESQNQTRTGQTKPAFQVPHLCSWALLNPAGGLTSWKGAKASTAEVTLDLRTSVQGNPNLVSDESNGKGQNTRSEPDNFFIKRHKSGNCSIVTSLCAFITSIPKIT